MSKHIFRGHPLEIRSMRVNAAFDRKSLKLYFGKCNFSLFVAVCEIFATEMCMTLTLAFRMAQG